MIPKTERLQEYKRLQVVSYGIDYVARPLLLFFSSENRLLWFSEVHAQIRRIFLDGYSVLDVRIRFLHISSFKIQNAFRWGEDATNAFEALKKAMAKLPMLASPYFNRPFVIKADASGYGVGAILMQDKKPIAFYSQFFVRTGQKSLKYLLEQRLIPGEHERWVSKFLGYDFEIQYFLGKEKHVADALSRRVESTQLGSLLVPLVLDWKELSMKKDIEKLVADCVICQLQKYSTMALRGLLQPLELPTKIWAEVSMGFIDGLPKSNGYTVIMVAVDQLSKYLEERDKLLEELKEQLNNAQERMKHYADEHMRDLEFNEAKNGEGVDSASSNLSAILIEDMEINLTTEQVEGIHGGTSEAKKEVLIKWKYLPGYESTWEPFVTIKKQFPEFHLEDKVAVWEGSIVAGDVVYDATHHIGGIGSALYGEKLKAFSWSWDELAVFGLSGIAKWKSYRGIGLWEMVWGEQGSHEIGLWFGMGPIGEWACYWAQLECVWAHKDLGLVIGLLSPRYGSGGLCVPMAEIGCKQNIKQSANNDYVSTKRSSVCIPVAGDVVYDATQHIGGIGSAIYWRRMDGLFACLNLYTGKETVQEIKLVHEESKLPSFVCGVDVFVLAMYAAVMVSYRRRKQSEDGFSVTTRTVYFSDLRRCAGRDATRYRPYWVVNVELHVLRSIRLLL
ncbi:putative mitochondrial protein [Tanacetum coccineum]